MSAHGFHEAIRCEGAMMSMNDLCLQCGGRIDHARLKRGAKVCGADCGTARLAAKERARLEQRRLERIADACQADGVEVEYPTQDEIAERAAEVRAGWTMGRYRRSAGMRRVEFPKSSIKTLVRR